VILRKKIILETERGRTWWHSLQTSLRKRLWSCRRTDYLTQTGPTGTSQKNSDSWIWKLSFRIWSGLPFIFTEAFCSFSQPRHINIWIAHRFRQRRVSSTYFSVNHLPIAASFGILQAQISQLFKIKINRYFTTPLEQERSLIYTRLYWNKHWDKKKKQRNEWDLLQENRPESATKRTSQFIAIKCNAYSVLEHHK